MIGPQVAAGPQRTISPQEMQQREQMRQQAQGGQQAPSGMAPMQTQPAYGQGQQGGYGQPTPQQWQQFMQYVQQLQQQYPQQQPSPYPQQGYQQRMQGYGQPNYNMPRLAPQAPPPGAAQGHVPHQMFPGQTVGATAIERPAQMTVRQPPVMSPAQTSMPVQSPAVAPPMAPETASRPVTAAPMTANPVQHALNNPALSMSDATQKVLEHHSLADEFLDHMKPYTYKYKDPSMEPRIQPTGGTYLGVMAQDLERIPHLGSQLVVETPHGKMVDQKTALSATMAGLARLNERLRAVEADSLKKKGKK